MSHAPWLAVAHAPLSVHHEAAGILMHRSDRRDQSGGYGEAFRRLRCRCYAGAITGGLLAQYGPIDIGLGVGGACCSGRSDRCERIPAASLC